MHCTWYDAQTHCLVCYTALLQGVSLVGENLQLLVRNSEQNKPKFEVQYKYRNSWLIFI